MSGKGPDFMQYFKKKINYHLWGDTETYYSKPHQVERLEWLKENSVGKILELGCRTGFVSKYLGVHTGVDLDPKRLRKGRLFRRGTVFLKMDARDLDFPDDSFDTVIVSEILEHMPKKASREVVEEAFRVGSKILITIPKQERFKRNPEHVWIPLEQKELEELLHGFNYRISESKTGEYFFAIINSMESKTSEN